jgi:hypothetical protein
MRARSGQLGGGRQVSKKEWRKPEVKSISAGSAENKNKNASDGGSAPNNHATS